MLEQTSTQDKTDNLQQDLEAFRKTSLPTRLAPQPPRETIMGLLIRGALSILAGLLAFIVVAGIVAAIVVPPWYRGLEPRYRVIWCNRIALLCDLEPERNEDNVYAFAGDASESDALLATSTPTSTTLPPTPTPTQEPTRISVVASATPLQATDAPPTSTPLPTIPPSSTPQPTPTIEPLPLMSTLNREVLRWEQQGWNNCGPTTLTIGLTYFGYTDYQQRAARFLKPNPEDTNVSPDQMVDYVNMVVGPELRVRALYRMGGTSQLIKRLIAHDFPVIVERGIHVEDSGWMGHYSLVVGFDDRTGEYLLFDSHFGYSGGEGRRFDQLFIERGWQQFNYTFIVIYETQRERELMGVLDEYANETAAATIALQTARDQASRDPDDKWAWFNMGTAYTILGNYEDAVRAYDRARTLDLPFRMLWYQFGPYIAYYHMQRYDDVLALALASERTTPYVEETYYYRGLVYARQGRVDSAVFQFDRALSYNSNFTPALQAKQAVLEGRFVQPN